MSEVFKNFFVIHITCSGQEPDAPDLPANFQFSMEKLVNQVEAVRKHFGKEYFFGLGVGLGAVVFLNYACTRAYQTHLRGQILISPTHKPSGWAEFFYEKSASFAMWMLGVEPGSLVHNQLLARYFTAVDAVREPDAYAQCADALSRVNGGNLARLVTAYAWRGAIEESALETLSLRSIVITQKWGYYDEDAVELNGLLPSSNSVYLKLDESSHLALQCADELASPLLLFFQGFGYCLEQQLNPPIQADGEKAADDSIARFNAKWAAQWAESDSDEDDD